MNYTVLTSIDEFRSAFNDIQALETTVKGMSVQFQLRKLVLDILRNGVDIENGPKLASG